MTQLGTTGPEVSRLGLGCMAMSNAYGPADEGRSLATIRHAVERGITLLDTGDFYGMGHNEMLIARALKELDRDSLVISVKFGALRGPTARSSGSMVGRRRVKAFCAYSLSRLGVDHIDSTAPLGSIPRFRSRTPREPSPS